MGKKVADPGGGHEGRRRSWTRVPSPALSEAEVEAEVEVGRPDPAGVGEVVPYRSYLLRLWPVRREGLASVRVSIDDVVTGERLDFSDLESLFLFLERI